MQYVSVGRRFVAILIDGVLIAIVTAPFGSSYTYQNGTFHYSSAGGGFLLQQLLWLAYFVVLEATVGATVGKLALGIRVVNADGSKLDWGSAIVRNILRIVDAFPYFIPYLVGAILVWTSPTRQRLGDRVGKTAVVTKASVGAGPRAGTLPPAGAPPPPPPPPGTTG